MFTFSTTLAYPCFRFCLVSARSASLAYYLSICYLVFSLNESWQLRIFARLASMGLIFSVQLHLESCSRLPPLYVSVPLALQKNTEAQRVPCCHSEVKKWLITTFAWCWPPRVNELIVVKGLKAAGPKEGRLTTKRVVSWSCGGSGSSTQHVIVAGMRLVWGGHWQGVEEPLVFTAAVKNGEKQGWRIRAVRCGRCCFQVLCKVMEWLNKFVNLIHESYRYSCG